MQKINEDISAFMEQVVEEEKAIEHQGERVTTFGVSDSNEHELFGVCAVGLDGKTCCGSNDRVRFPLESTSKALTLALALEDVGHDEFFRHIGQEPRGDAFNSAAAIEEGIHGIPSNPMINAGAIATTAMIHGQNGTERFARILDFVRRLADNDSIDYNHTMYEEEDKDLNRGLFYIMRSHGVLQGREEDKLTPYFKQTSIEMNCVDLARIAAVFANYGRDLKSGKQLISERTVQTVLTLMFTTGMYQASGQYALEVGMPSKSGISGCIMAVAPGRMGLATIGPALDDSGNSIAGVRILKKLAQRWQLGVFSRT
ncbi:glutaminase A [Aliidiomarina sedimenti]|nr:glutaminase A [Aliidiomarina sedimenti]